MILRIIIKDKDMETLIDIDLHISTLGSLVDIMPSLFQKDYEITIMRKKDD